MKLTLIFALVFGLSSKGEGVASSSGGRVASQELRDVCPMAANSVSRFGGAHTRCSRSFSALLFAEMSDFAKHRPGNSTSRTAMNLRSGISLKPQMRLY